MLHTYALVPGASGGARKASEKSMVIFRMSDHVVLIYHLDQSSTMNTNSDGYSRIKQLRMGQMRISANVSVLSICVHGIRE